jgi:glutaredoxin
VASLELYGAAWCPHTQEMREWLEWQRRDFVEYDVERDAAARQRLRELAGARTSIPVLIEDDKVVQIGWQGRTCMIDAGPAGCDS